MISFSVAPFSFCHQSFPASGSFPMSRLFPSGGQSTGASASHQSLMGYSPWTHRRVRHNFTAEQQPHLNHLCIPNSEYSGALGGMTGSGWSMTRLKAHNCIIRYWRAGYYLALSPHSVYCLNTDDALKKKKMPAESTRREYSVSSTQS